MIGRLSGRLVECTPGAAVLDVGGVGYAVQIPLSTFYALSQNHRSQAELFIYTHVREDAIHLYGFATREEREAFERLVAISGVGPKIALGILSGIGAQELERAVQQSDRARLERIPGVGRKTAERLLLELRHQYEKEGRKSSKQAREGEEPGGGLRSDAVSALVHLGYQETRAVRAVESALRELGETASLEAVLRAALRSLVR
jgi:Holliday junction DNA helicase RuvA